MRYKAVITSLTLGLTLPLLGFKNAEAIQTLKTPTESPSSVFKVRSTEKPISQPSLIARKPQGKWAHVGFANNIIEKHRRKYDIPGMSVAIAKNGKIIYANGFGFKNLGKKIKASKLTRYRLASVSKPVTAILAMEMREKGRPGKKLLLNRNIRTYLPKILPAHHKYRVRDLLSHQSGVRHYKKGKDATKNVKKHYVRTQDALNLFIKDKLVAKPGSKYSYSTHGYTILAAAIEKISGRTFFEYASSRFRSWGLKDLSPELAKLNQRNRSQIYKSENGKNKLSKRDDLSWKYAGGGYQSSVVDLANLGIKLINGEILNQKSLDLMWSRQKTNNGKTTRYGLGWSIGRDEDGRKIVAHSGAQNGAASYWRIYPNDKVVVVILSNKRGHKARNLGAYLGRVAVTGSTAKPIN